MMKLENTADFRKRRHLRTRRKIRGTETRPRMCVFVSGKHMYVQFIDDGPGKTLSALSTLKMDRAGGNNVAMAGALGKKAAEAVLEKGIKSVVFDRSGNRYAGRVKAVAEAARAAGLKL